MRYLVIYIILSFFSFFANAQKEVTKFLGIPVDGSKSEMIDRLIEKGFAPLPEPYCDIVQGVFNGQDVIIHVVTNGDKVCRLMVCDTNHIDSRSIIDRFNTLCRQFEQNPQYLSSESYQIPEDEDIVSNIALYNKRYEAIFCQRHELSDEEIIEAIKPTLIAQYQNLNPEHIIDIEKEINKIADDYVYELISKKPVWFFIAKDEMQKFYIIICYDNEYNKAHGEDL